MTPGAAATRGTREANQYSSFSSGNAPIQKCWIGEPEPDTGSVSKRTTKSIFTIAEKYRFKRRYPKSGSPSQIQSQEMLPILVRPSLGFNTAIPCFSWGNFLGSFPALFKNALRIIFWAIFKSVIELTSRALHQHRHRRCSGGSSRRRWRR